MDEEISDTHLVVVEWISAIYHDQDDEAATALTHPSFAKARPGVDVGEHMRQRFPWLGGAAVSFSEPWPLEGVPDMELVQLETAGAFPPARVIVLRRLHLATDEPEKFFVVDVISLNA
jgi:hypothetical protein